MDLDGKNVDTNSMWEWQEEEYCLQKDSRKNVSHCLWDEVNQIEDSFMYLLEEQTPIKDCVDFGCQVSDVGDIANKELEECMESSQMKRRRMLQFTSDTNDIGYGSQQFTSVREGNLLEDGQPEQLEWNSQWNLGFKDDRCSFNSDGWDQQSEGWLNCLNESEMHSSANEMHDCVASGDQVNVSEFCNVSPEMETDVVQETPKPTPPKICKGRKSYLKNPMKLATSVAYPFALIKPCGVQGDVTLNDINLLIHAPPSTSKHVKDESPSLSYPTSAFSGKPVVVKTKIRTEGGKGSITIMRTKG